MTFYPAAPSDATLTGGERDAAELLGRAGVVAVRLADLASPADHGLGKDGRTALAAAGPGEIKSGDVVVFCKPVAVATAVVRGDGRVQAAGHPADHARLGVLEQQLDAMAGTAGTIDEIARSAKLKGKVKGTAKRAMTPALAIRCVLPMTLMPEADYPRRPRGAPPGDLLHRRPPPAARRAAVTSVRAGTATASLPRRLAEAARDRVLAALARRRVRVDRHRHRDRRTKARLGFPTAGPHLPTRTAAAEVHICGPLAA
jgi:hypothetical protein